jgi:hypothetical protein
MQQQHALEVSSEFFDLAGDTAQRLLASGGTLVSIGAVATGYGGAVTTEASDHVMDPVRPERNINAWPACDHCTIARADHDIMLGICTYAVVTTLPQDLIAHSPSMSPVEHNGKTITGAQNGRFLLYVRVHDMIGIRPEPVLGIIVRFHKERLDYKPAAACLPHAGFFMPMGPSYEGWEDLKAETVAAVAEGRVRVMLDEGSAGHIGLEGVYAAQARMRLGVNSGKIYTVIDEALCRGERASL